MGFLKFLRPSHAGNSDRGGKAGRGGSTASSDGLVPPTPSFYGPSASTSRVPSRSSVQLTDVDRDSNAGRPDSPAGSFASSRKDRDKKQRLLGIGRREKELKSIPYSSFTPPSRSTVSVTKDEPSLLSPLNVPTQHDARQRSSSHLARPPTSPIAIHKRTSSIPSAPPPPELGSLDFGSPLGNGQRFSAIFAEVLTGNHAAGSKRDEDPPTAATLAVPSFSPSPSAPNSRPISGISMDGIGPNPPDVNKQLELKDYSQEDVNEVERLKVEEEKDKDKKSAFWKVRNRRNSKGGEPEAEERVEVVTSAEPKATLREPSDKPKLRRPSSHVWQFARNRTSSYNVTETIEASALDVNESAIDDGSFQLKSFRHVSSASMSLPAAVDQAPASPTLETPPIRPYLHSRAPSATGSSASFDEDRPAARVSVAAFRKGIRAQSFVALDRDNASTRPSVAGTAPAMGVGPDDDLPLSFLAGDNFKQKQQAKRPSLPNTYLAPATATFSSAPASPISPVPPPPPSSFPRRGASPLRSDEATEQLGLSIQRPRSVTKPSEASKGFVVLSRTASRTDLTSSPSQPPASYTSPGQGSEEMLMPSSEEICTSPLDMEMPSNISRVIPESGRKSPGAALNTLRRNSLQPNAQPIPVPSPNHVAMPRPAETTNSSRPTSFFDDPLRLISSFIGRDDEPRIPTPPPRSDDGEDEQEQEQQSSADEPKKDDTLGLDLDGLNLPLPPHAMPDDAPSPRSSLGRGQGPRPPLHARLASASGLSTLGSPSSAPLSSPLNDDRPQSLLSPAQIKPATTRRDSHDSEWRRPPVRPKASVSSFQSAGAKSRGNADAWADSSSDDDAPPKRKTQGSTPKLSTAVLPRPSFGNMRVASSGASGSAHTAPPSRVPNKSNKSTVPQRSKKAESSSSESDEDASSSSSDEPLATVRQKASMSSLNINVVPKAAAPPVLGNRRPSASAIRAPQVPGHTPPAMPRHASSRSSLYQSSPVAMNSTLPSPPVLASNVPKRSPQTFAPALRGQPSPASSISGKTGDSSSLGAPLPSTPKDSRRVSFLPDDAKGILKERASASILGDAERDSRRNERRREEAKQAVELGNLVNGPPAHVPLAEPMNMSPNPMAQNGYNPYMNQPGSYDPRMAWAMQQAAAGPHYAMMHQQAMAFAKQQYQQAMAAAAMQAANDEWERSSAMTGFSGAPSLPAMPSYGGFPASPYGMPQMFPAMSNYAGSEYGGGRQSMYGSPGGGWGSQSVYGESFGPPPSLPTMPPMPRSSTSHDVRSDMPTPRKERMSSYENDGATPRRRHFSSSSVDLPKVLAGSHHSEERRHPGGARQSRKAPLLQAHGGVPSAPSSWRRDLDEREELDDRQKERARPRGAR